MAWGTLETELEVRSLSPQGRKGGFHPGYSSGSALIDRPIFWAERKRAMVQIDASNAAPLIKKTLRKGGSFYVQIGNERRMISHDPILDKAPTKLPWPFSLFQPHIIGLSIYSTIAGSSSEEFSREEAVRMIQCREKFDYRNIDHAVSIFLKDLPAKHPVMILSEK
jgi:hypothetical protein